VGNEILAISQATSVSRGPPGGVARSDGGGGRDRLRDVL